MNNEVIIPPEYNGIKDFVHPDSIPLLFFHECPGVLLWADKIIVDKEIYIKTEERVQESQNEKTTIWLQDSFLIELKKKGILKLEEHSDLVKRNLEKIQAQIDFDVDLYPERDFCLQDENMSVNALLFISKEINKPFIANARINFHINEKILLESMNLDRVLPKLFQCPSLDSNSNRELTFDEKKILAQRIEYLEGMSKILEKSSPDECKTTDIILDFFKPQFRIFPDHLCEIPYEELVKEATNNFDYIMDLRKSQYFNNFRSLVRDFSNEIKISYEKEHIKDLQEKFKNKIWEAEINAIEEFSWVKRFEKLNTLLTLPVAIGGIFDPSFSLVSIGQVAIQFGVEEFERWEKARKPYSWYFFIDDAKKTYSKKHVKQKIEVLRKSH